MVSLAPRQVRRGVGVDSRPCETASRGNRPPARVSRGEGFMTLRHAWRVAGWARAVACQPLGLGNPLLILLLCYEKKF